MDQTTSNLLEAPADIITTDDTLKEINGEGGAYSNEAASLDRLAEMEFLVLPAGLPIPEVPFEEVGTKKARDYFSPVYVLAVYILNKAICADTTNNNNVRFGLARMEAVMLGWFSNQRKVKMEPVPNYFMTLVAADSDLITELLEPARDAAWLVPMAAEYIFRSKGHHYTPALKSDYIKRCGSIFKASMKPDVGMFLPSDLLYHYAFHWKVMKAHEDSGLPDTIKLRMTCSPVGAALVTTTAAVLKPFSAGGFLDDLLALNITKIDKIFELDAKIRSNPTLYHMNPTAYGEAFLAAGPRKEFEDGKEEAKKLAPLLQAFCDTMLRNAPLGRQKVLRKHANSNPALRQSAKRFFQEYCREVPTSLDEVFSQLKKSKAGIEDPSGADGNPSLRQGAKRLFHEVGRGVPTSLAEVFGQKKKSKAAIENLSDAAESG
ncbi:hypothetical protein Bca52824_020730 [Brassica carinata]|uniref:Nucleocapsid protein n=1 Tax=Brassica carinata TaxID=52824 RepID=A0A8X7VVH7_BRACI|nr:hypothetical protein Bca52824_020730 [Brassica carinata]